MKDRLDVLRIIAEKGGKVVRRDDIRQFALRDILPLVVMTQYVADDDVAVAPRL